MDDAVTDVPDIGDALPLVATDPRWLGIALDDLDAVHADHLHCERKAASSALSLIRSYPERADPIKGLSVMGGSVGGGFTAAPLGKVDGVERIGNYTKWAEFNVLIDPEAAASLFDNPVLKGKTTLIALDLTHLVLATKEVQDQILYGPDYQGEKTGKGKTDLRTMLVELLNFFAATYRYVAQSSLPFYLHLETTRPDNNY